ncbi:hypothetical protein ERJ75_001647200 [Trypanosoma vivax]|uniref:Uncharacterized protein n=1 Tax=Trypanosoma vivax (strain Y486) TaxID=1055687 RepID=G0U9B1_TRYVY|nr:hypothetical protein ERJ75_001647200 [Trypanosoma vivax]CCC54196.1 conserved hypothetical protein [Trypanosoma vivax Y486]
MKSRYFDVAYYPTDTVCSNGCVFATIPFLCDFRLSTSQVIYHPPDSTKFDPVYSAGASGHLPQHSELPVITLSTEVAPFRENFRAVPPPEAVKDLFLCAPEREGLDAVAEELQRGLHTTLDEDYWSEEYWKAVQGSVDADSSSCVSVIDITASCRQQLSLISDPSLTQPSLAQASPTVNAGRRGCVLSRGRGRVSIVKQHSDERMRVAVTKKLAGARKRPGAEDSLREQRARSGKRNSGDSSQLQSNEHRRKQQRMEGVSDTKRNRLAHQRGKTGPTVATSKVHSGSAGCRSNVAQKLLGHEKLLESESTRRGAENKKEGRDSRSCSSQDGSRLEESGVEHRGNDSTPGKSTTRSRAAGLAPISSRGVSSGSHPVSGMPLLPHDVGEGTNDVFIRGFRTGVTARGSESTVQTAVGEHGQAPAVGDAHLASAFTPPLDVNGGFQAPDLAVSQRHICDDGPVSRANKRLNNKCCTLM